MGRIEIISVVVSVIFLLFILEQVRKKRLQEAYSLLWVVMGVFFVLLSLFVPLLVWFSKLIGIYYAPAALLLFLVFTLILICTQFSIVISKHSSQIKTLTQELALLKNKTKDGKAAKVQSDDSKTHG